MTCFDATPGVRPPGKPHSVVNLTGRRDRVALLANAACLLGFGADRPGGPRPQHPAVLVPGAGLRRHRYAYAGSTAAAELIGVWGNRSDWLAFVRLATRRALLALAR